MIFLVLFSQIRHKKNIYIYDCDFLQVFAGQMQPLGCNAVSKKMAVTTYKHRVEVVNIDEKLDEWRVFV